jgi:hypothetical protein
MIILLVIAHSGEIIYHRCIKSPRFAAGAFVLFHSHPMGRFKT